MQSWKGAEMNRIKRLICKIFDRYLRKRAIENHRKMWRWLAEHPGKRKFEYLEMYDPKADLSNDCYLCEYAEGKSLHETGNICDKCYYCPLDWGGAACPKIDSLFDRWMEERHFGGGTEIARQIAELPERKDR